MAWRFDHHCFGREACFTVGSDDAASTDQDRRNNRRQTEKKPALSGSGHMCFPQPLYKRHLGH